MDNKVIFAIIAIALVVLGGYLYYNVGASVSAQGVANVIATPDEVSVYINIESRNSSAELAQAQESEITDNVITELVKMGFERKDIQTLSLSVYQEYDWSYGTRIPKGYVAMHQIVVKTSDFDNVGEIVDKVIDAGALVSAIDFEISQEKQNEYKKQALREAGEDAKEKAEATAEGLGKSLGRLVSVESENFYYQPWVYYSRGGMDVAEDSISAKSAAVSISPRDIEVSASIQVRYKLGLF